MATSTFRPLRAVLIAGFVAGALDIVAAFVSFMNFVVVPLSAVPKRPFDWPRAPIIVFVHIVCVGIPIAVVLKRSLTLARH